MSTHSCVIVCPRIHKGECRHRPGSVQANCTECDEPVMLSKLGQKNRIETDAKILCLPCASKVARTCGNYETGAISEISAAELAHYNRLLRDGLPPEKSAAPPNARCRKNTHDQSDSL